MCSRSETEQNLVAFQQNGRILFRCCRPISPGQEFRVWYADEYAQGLGIIWDKIWDKKSISLGNYILDFYLLCGIFVPYHEIECFCFVFKCHAACSE